MATREELLATTPDNSTDSEPEHTFAQSLTAMLFALAMGAGGLYGVAYPSDVAYAAEPANEIVHWVIEGVPSPAAEHFTSGKVDFPSLTATASDVERVVSSIAIQMADYIRVGWKSVTAWLDTLLQDVRTPQLAAVATTEQTAPVLYAEPRLGESQSPEGELDESPPSVATSPIVEYVTVQVPAIDDTQTEKVFQTIIDTLAAHSDLMPANP
jgi:hypothetical protein